MNECACLDGNELGNALRRAHFKVKSKPSHGIAWILNRNTTVNFYDGTKSLSWCRVLFPVWKTKHSFARITLKYCITKKNWLGTNIFSPEISDSFLLLTSADWGLLFWRGKTIRFYLNFVSSPLLCQAGKRVKNILNWLEWDHCFTIHSAEVGERLSDLTCYPRLITIPVRINVYQVRHDSGFNYI